MRPRLPVSSDPEGLPCAQVPFGFMWELVEYLSVQRIAVTYLYADSHFRVTFTRMELAAAQRILDAWASRLSPERQVA